MKVRPSVKPMCDKCKVIKRKGKIRVHHFAHSGKGETAFCSETALHLAAKEILKEEQKILKNRKLPLAIWRELW